MHEHWLERSLDEILARYAYARSDSLDIFVEGETDARLIEHHRAFANRPTANLLPVSHITTSDTLLAEVCDVTLRESGNRGKVIAIVRSVNARFASRPMRFVGVVDADLDAFCGRASDDHILRTDFTDLGMYYYSTSTAIDIITRNLNVSRTSASTVVASIEDAARDLFAIQIAKHRLLLNFARVNLRRYLTISQEAFLFNLRAYIDISVQGLRPDAKVAFENAFLAARAALNGVDIRSTARSHDLFGLLSFYFRRVSGNAAFGSEEAVATIFLSGLDLSLLQQYELFQKI